MAELTDLRKGFRVGPWQVLPDRGLLRGEAGEQHVEPLPMDVLVTLAGSAGDVVNKNQLVDTVWHGRPVSDEVITRCISVLRRALGDDARSPSFIENVPRRGYRLMQPVVADDAPASVPAAGFRRAYLLPLLGGFAALALIVFAAWFRSGGDAAAKPIASVVVMPVSCKADREYLCFGFSEALTSTLYLVENLRVVKSRQPASAGSSLRDVAREFAVDAVIDTQVRSDGARTAVVAELVDGRDESVLFSNVYSGPETGIFNLQERVATDVRRAILGNTASELQADSRPASFAAFDRFAEGQYEFEKRSAESIYKAIELFGEAIELDPHYGPAYLMLAYAHALLPEYAGEDQKDRHARALAYARRGSEMDPGIRDAAATIDAFIAHKRGEWVAAERGYRRALGANTVYPLTHHLYSRLLASVGRLDDSLAEARHARELDPHSAVLISRLAIANFWVDELKDAERYFARTLTMDLQSPINDLAYALFRIRQGRIDEARRFAKDGLEKYGADAGWVDPVFDGIASAALREEARSLVAELANNGVLPARVEITLWALLGDPDRAMQIARRLETEGEIFEAELLFIPQFRELRGHPDFGALMAAIGLAEYWQTFGCLFRDDSVSCSQVRDIG